MGNRGSSASNINILAVGMPNTGKSHFVSFMQESGKVNSETMHHTMGFLEAETVYRGKKFHVKELGGMMCKSWGLMAGADSRTVHCVCWFVNDTDSEEELYRSRSAVLTLMQLQIFQGVPLCLVQNVGRPEITREVELGRHWNCAGGTHRTYTEHKGMSVDWNNLQDRLELRQLCRSRHVYRTQLSYIQGNTFTSLFDWILEHVAARGSVITPVDGSGSEK